LSRALLSRCNVVDIIADYTIEVVATAVDKLRAMSPLYELFLDGVDISKIQWQAH
jgi:cysteine desulfurase